jgi:hypothetical protein
MSFLVGCGKGFIVCRVSLSLQYTDIVESKNTIILVASDQEEPSASMFSLFVCVLHVCVYSRGWVQDNKREGWEPASCRQGSLATAWDWNGSKTTTSSKGFHTWKNGINPHAFIYRALYIMLCIFLFCRLKTNHMRKLRMSFIFYFWNGSMAANSYE